MSTPVGHWRFLDNPTVLERLPRFIGGTARMKRRKAVRILTLIIIVALVAFVFLPVFDVTFGNPRADGIPQTYYASASYVLFCAGTEYVSPAESYMWVECVTVPGRQ
jgi:hypothetical protein